MGDEISIQFLVSKESTALTLTTSSSYKYLSGTNGILKITFPKGYQNLQYLTITVLSPDKVDICDGNFIRQDEVFNCTFDRCVLLYYDVTLILKLCYYCSGLLQPNENVLSVSIFDVLNEVFVLHTNSHVWFDDIELKKITAVANQSPKFSYSTLFISSSENNLVRDIKVVLFLSALSGSMYVLYDRYHFTIADVNSALDILHKSFVSQISTLIADIRSFLYDGGVRDLFSLGKTAKQSIGGGQGRNQTGDSDTNSSSGGDKPNLFRYLYRLEQTHISTPVRARVFNACKVCSLILVTRVLSNKAGETRFGSAAQTSYHTDDFVAEPIVPPARRRFGISKSLLYGPRIPLDPAKSIMPAGEYPPTRRRSMTRRRFSSSTSNNNNNKINGGDYYIDNNRRIDHISESNVSIVDAFRRVISTIISNALSVVQSR